MSQDTISIELEPREVFGKRVKDLRNAGYIPGIIHDHGKASVPVVTEYQAFFRAYALAGKHHPLQLKAGDRKFTVLVKEITRDPVYNAVSHIVFGAVKANEKVTAEVPVRARFAEGNESSPAERAGLVVLEQLTSVEVEALPKYLPDALEFDGEKLVAVGDHATVADLVVPQGVVIKTDPTHAVATVFEPSALQAANDAAGGDAESAAAGDVASDHESGSVEGAQKDEIRPGGKEEKEDKSQGHNPTKS